MAVKVFDLKFFRNRHHRTATLAATARVLLSATVNERRGRVALRNRPAVHVLSEVVLRVVRTDKSVIYVIGLLPTGRGGADEAERPPARILDYVFAHDRASR